MIITDPLSPDPLATGTGITVNGSGVKTKRNFGPGPDRNRIKEVLTKQQVTRRVGRFITLLDCSQIKCGQAPSHKLDTIGRYKEL